MILESQLEVAKLFPLALRFLLESKLVSLLEPAWMLAFPSKWEYWLAVAVTIGVFVGDSVGTGEFVGVSVGVKVFVAVALLVGVGVSVGVGVFVGVSVAVAVFVAVAVKVAVGVIVGQELLLPSLPFPSSQCS